MTELSSAPSAQFWHSSDLMVRIAQGDITEEGQDGDLARSVSDRNAGAEARFGIPTLALVARDETFHERLSVLRSSAWDDRSLVAFGALNRSQWALDAFAGRITRFGHDWASLREAVILQTSAGVEPTPALDSISLDGLYGVCELLHALSIDAEAERAILAYVAMRFNSGHELSSEHIGSFIERLLQCGLSGEARSVLAKAPNDEWLSLALAVELEHPRFGGSIESMLALLNEPYRRLGIEPLSLTPGGDAPFLRLHAEPRALAQLAPLVTVIVTCRNPGVELIATVRSIVLQTLQNWELIVADDASSAEFDQLLDDVASLDSRVRVVRSDVAGGESARINEVMQSAQGEFVVLQDSYAWSHPHRLEIQLQDLLANPARLGNTVHGVYCSEDLSFVSDRGPRLIDLESSLMFRREPVLSVIGYFDSVRTGAAGEFRQRLASAMMSEIPALVSGAPLQIVLASETESLHPEVANGRMPGPSHAQYSSAAQRFHEKIESGAQDPYVSFPLIERPFSAPMAWMHTVQELRFDLLVVLDCRVSPDRVAFLRKVADEIKDAVNSGLRIALVQSASLTGPLGFDHYLPELQDLINVGAVTCVASNEAVHAETVIVRHAGAAQGHPAAKWAISVSRAVIVEDGASGDARGTTIAKPDVMNTVATWFEAEPTWIVALPELPDPTIIAVGFEGGHLRLKVSTGVPARARYVRLVNDARSEELEIVGTGTDYFLASSGATQAVEGDWEISVVFDVGGDVSVVKACGIASGAVFWNREGRVALRKDEQTLRVFPQKETTSLPSSEDFASDHLSLAVARARVVGERFELTIAGAGSAALVAVYALREVESGAVRRRDFSAVTSSDGQKTWQRPLRKFAGSRWLLFGSFTTAFGRVEYPLGTSTDIHIDGNEHWQPQVLPGGHLRLLPPTPGKLILAGRRAVRAVEGRVGDRIRHATRLGSSTAGTSSKANLGSDLSAPRVQLVPIVSVVMPVYNVEPFLDEAIVSVLKQDFSNLELIIVDDASTDNGLQIIEKYWRKDPRVRVFTLEHNTLGGAGMPSNIGIRAARGTYVAFADSDDHVSKTALSKLVKLGENNAADLVIGDFRTFTADQKEGSESYDRAVWADLPLGTLISAFSHPDLFRLSPVPWRKLYRREFLESNAILFPEGDYFFEDNPLHWFVLSRAERVVMCDEVVSFHRMERAGQTMGAQTYKQGAFVNHMNTIRQHLAGGSVEHRNAMFESFLGYLDRTHWVADRQAQPAAAALIKRGIGSVYRQTLKVAPRAVIPPENRAKLEADYSAYPDVDLTIVVPVFNSADLIRQTLDSVLALRGVRFNVLLVDDGSTDSSLAVIHEYESRYPNVHVFAQGNRGAGRARNSVIPLCTGRYTFFLDADDTVDAKSLAAAVRQADADEADLLFMKYRIDFVDEGRSRGMFQADQDVWERLPSATSNSERQRLVAQLINYPWNRIIRTTLLHDANIFFGATVVHNDVQFHWHSIVSASHISYLDVEACSHRKFATRQQVTNVNDARRLVVLDALRATNERISPLDGFVNVQDEWEAFVLHLVEWAKSRVPESHQSEYAERSAVLVRSLSSSTV